MPAPKFSPETLARIRAAIAGAGSGLTAREAADRLDSLQPNYIADCMRHLEREGFAVSTVERAPRQLIRRRYRVAS